MRKKVSSGKSRRLFTRKAHNVQSLNYAPVPMRGGFRI